MKVIGDKDQDGFYWGELRGRRGFVPHNMVTEIDENQIGAQGVSSTGVSGTGTTTITTTGICKTIEIDKIKTK